MSDEQRAIKLSVATCPVQYNYCPQDVLATRARGLQIRRTSTQIEAPR